MRRRLPGPSAPSSSPPPAGTVEEMHEQARAAGASDAARDAERLRRAAELDARTRVLASRRATYDALRERALAAVLETRSTPAYAELLARLAAAARADLGPSAAIETDPGHGRGRPGAAGSARSSITRSPRSRIVASNRSGLRWRRRGGERRHGAARERPCRRGRGPGGGDAGARRGRPRRAARRGDRDRWTASPPSRCTSTRAACGRAIPRVRPDCRWWHSSARG